MKPFSFTIFLLICISSCLLAQDKQNDDYYQQLELKWKRLRDSLSLQHPFVPAVSSIMIKEKAIELNLFNSIITANRFRDDKGITNDLPLRETYFYSTLQATYGISPKSRVNIGFDINTVTGRVDQDRNSSLFKVFHSGTDGNAFYASTVTSAALRVRWRPLEKNNNFTIQASVGIPTNISSKNQRVLGQSQYSFLTQFLYNHPFSKRLFLFSQLSMQYNFKRDPSPAIFYTPATVYLSWLATNKFILFGLLNYVPIFATQDKWAYRYTLQPGGGIQYQLSKSFLANLYCTKDVKGKNYPDFIGYNLSLRYVTR